MPPQTRWHQMAGARSHRGVWLAALALVLAGLAVYANSFRGGFTFDDVPNILQNPTIQHGGWAALTPPAGASTVSARPLVNFSLALNYQLGGFNVWGYHALNLAVHLLAGLTLFGLVRRTLERPVLRQRYGAAALPLAFFIALLWTVHPLQTESVTYVVQRAESLMGLWYLLTLYCFVRAVESSRAWVWYPLSASACVLGMVTKESMATAPLIVLLYDRTFITGTFAAAWRQRWKFHAALMCTWLPLAWIIVSISLPGNTTVKNAGLDSLSPGMKSFAYGLKQCEAIGQYLWLSFWPHPLVFNYGGDVLLDPLEVAPQIVLLALLVGGTIYAVWRQPSLGFLGAWFFVILAPTSSVVPLRGQTVAEHHMYLSLVTVLVLAVLGLHTVLGPRTYVAFLALAFALGSLTFARNGDYRTDVSIWADTVQNRPDNSANHDNEGQALEQSGRRLEALPRYEMAVQLNPANSLAENNLGSLLNALDRPRDALDHLLRSIALDSDLAKPHYNLGYTYYLLNQPVPARDEYLAALRINPDYPDAHTNLGNVYLQDFGLADKAIAEYNAALQADPRHVSAHSGLANIYLQIHQWAEAIPHLKAVIQLKPDFGPAYLGLGNALIGVGHASEAIPQFETAVRLMPGNTEARSSLEKARQLASSPPNGPPLPSGK